MFRVTALIAVSLALPPAAAAQTAREDFLALDVSGGFIGGSRTTISDDDAASGSKGWEIGSTLRFLKPWFGVAGHVSRTTGGGTRTADYLAGVRLTGPYAGDLRGRGFAHVLAGMGDVRTSSTLSERSPVLLIGAGFDVLQFVRFQVDYSNRGVDVLPRHDGRAMFGATLPLCFRGCRSGDVDGVSVSGGGIP